MSVTIVPKLWLCVISNATKEIVFHEFGRLCFALSNLYFGKANASVPPLLCGKHTSSEPNVAASRMLFRANNG